jgi:hypothetical protein
VKIAPSTPSISMEKGVDSSMCVILLLSENVFEDVNVVGALRYVRDVVNTRKQRIPVILVQEGSSTNENLFKSVTSSSSSGKMIRIFGRCSAILRQQS